MYEGSLCVCCMSTDDLHDLFEYRNDNHFVGNYAKILNSCFNIEVIIFNYYLNLNINKYSMIYKYKILKLNLFNDK